jgi:hypothetical protein
MSETPQPPAPDNVVHLKLATAEQIVQQDSVDLLESYADLARRGEITSVAIVALKPSGGARYGFSECREVLCLIGALRLLERLLLQEVNSHAVDMSETEEDQPDA